MPMTSRAEFALKDPNALGALLEYDWRSRGLLTDAEAVGERGEPGALTGEASTGVLRQLQRLRWIRAVHGVRPHGGRMRLWPLEETLKAQVALDLRAVTRVKLAACVAALQPVADEIEADIAAWRRHVGAPADPRPYAPVFAPEGDLTAVFGAPTRLVHFAARSTANFVARNRFDAVSAPAFLL